MNPTRQMEYDPKIKAASMVYPVRFEVVPDDVREKVTRLKSIMNGASEPQKTATSGSSKPQQGVSIGMIETVRQG